MKKIHNSQSGSAILAGLLASSALLTIALMITTLTNQETKNAKLQEDSSRARAAAEAGIDYLLDQQPEGTVELETILPQSDDITGTAEITTEVSNSFTTPLMTKDSQYTFYLTGYDPDTQQVIQDVFNETLTIGKLLPTDSGSCGTNAFAVEVTFINAVDGIVTRRLIDDECNIITGEGNELDINFDEPIDTSGFRWSPHVMVLRVIAPSANFDGAKLVVTRGGGVNWPAQGRSYISEAVTGGKVTKKIKLFQSYPQFPTEFFVTAF